MESFDKEIDGYMISCRLRKQAIRSAAAERLDIMWAKRAIQKYWDSMHNRPKGYPGPDEYEEFYNLYVFEYLEEVEHNLRVDKEAIKYHDECLEKHWTLAKLFNQ